jgi:hypothetical protein
MVANNMKVVIDFLTLSRPEREPLFYRDWTRIEGENGEFWRKDEFRCELRRQKVKLYEVEADEYLRFAEQDAKEDTEKGRVNALRNAAQAERCRVDELLKLLNLNSFSSRSHWNLPKKKKVLESFGIPRLEILQRMITSERNKSEHEHIKPERQKVRDAVELSKLFLIATRQYVEGGYIASATLAYESWFKPALVAATWFGGELGQSISAKYGYEDGFSDEIHLAFALEHETITLSYLSKEIYRKCYLKTGKERTRKEIVTEKGGPITIFFRECHIEDVVNLMAQLLEKGRG